MIDVEVQRQYGIDMTHDAHREEAHGTGTSQLPEEGLLSSYRVPPFATVLFVLTMLSVYFLAMEVIEYYAGHGIELHFPFG